MISEMMVGFLLLVTLASATSVRSLTYNSDRFDDNYAIDWGGDHIKYIDNGRVVQLSMDKFSGSGFSSKAAYNSGFFRLSIKTPPKDTAGVVTAFYLSSNTSHHDELDFEFLGNREGRPVTLQTNIFTNGHGNREQRIHLWFDPSQAFHDYKVLWNPYQIVFFVDDTPIRVFANQQATNEAVEYPSQAMQIKVSLWNGESWATNGGKDKINWAVAPFLTQFQGPFHLDGCYSLSQRYCSSPNLWWNNGPYKQLTPTQQSALSVVRKRYLFYDYCSDKQRFLKLPPECQQ